MGKIVLGDGTVYTTQGGVLVPATPIAPSAYSLPGGPTFVSTAAALKTALAANTPNIVLQDGTYDNATNFQGFDSNLYSQNLGGAILTAGLGVNPTGATKGPTVQGLKLACSDLAKASSGVAALEVWDPYLASPGVKVLDCQFDGGSGTVVYGMRGSAMPNGVVQRCTVKNYRDGGGNFPTGMRLQDAGSGIGPYSYATVTDLDFSNISAATPGSGGGTAETGLWMGHPVTNPVARIRSATCGWMGMWTGNACRDTTFTDLIVDLSGIIPGTGSRGVQDGIYSEHFTLNCIFQNFLLNGCNYGFISEWNDDFSPPSGTWNTVDTSTTSPFTIPAITGTVVVAVGNTANFTNDPSFVGLWVQGYGFFGVTVNSGTSLTLTNLGFPNQAAPGTVVPSGTHLYNGNPAGHYNTYKNGTVNSSNWGIYLDQGTEMATIQNVVFNGQTQAAIRAYLNIATSGTIGVSPTISGNTYNLGVGGVAVMSP